MARAGWRMEEMGTAAAPANAMSSKPMSAICSGTSSAPVDGERLQQADRDQVVAGEHAHPDADPAGAP